MTPPHNAVSWSAVCDGCVSRSYSLFSCFFFLNNQADVIKGFNPTSRSLNYLLNIDNPNLINCGPDTFHRITVKLIHLY